MPSTPASSARRASSGCRMPLSRIGSFVRSRRNGQVLPRQLRPREDLREALHGGAPAPALQVLDERPGIRARQLHQRAQRLWRGLRRRRVAVARALRHQAAEHRVARVLREPLAAQEREEGGLEVARAPADHRGVEREHDRLAAARFGARDEALDQVVRRAPVELEPARAVAQHLGALLHRPRRLVGEDHRHAGLARRARDRDVGLAVGELEHADRRQQERGVERAAEQLDRRVGLRGPAQHPRHDPVPREGGAVLAHRVLRAGAGLDVGEGVGGHRLAGRLLEPLGVERDARAASAHPAEVDGRLARASDHGG